MRFEIFLEGERFVFVRKGTVPDELPWFEFGGVSGSAGIVLGQPPLQVFRWSGNSMLRMM
jgi:hypothetical protein